jgi:hypothetical protein
MCILSFPRCSANFFFDLLVLGFAELSAAIVDTPEMLDLTVVDKIESQCCCSSRIGPLRFACF